jgi:DNA-binding MarR family transcriptional regulator
VLSAAPLNDTLADDLLHLARLLHRQSSPVRRGELTPEQFWLLRELGRHGPMSMRQLAASLELSPSSVTTACKRLARDGLLTRERHGTDERVVIVTLTRRGKQQLARWRQRRHEQAAQLLSPLSPTEQAQLQRLLRRALDEAQRVGLEEEDEPASVADD